MSRLRVLSFTISLDGYGAGPNQDLKNPFGTRDAQKITEWFLNTRTWNKMHGQPGGEATGADEAFAKRGFENIGAWILGRNMFGPIRGPWPDNSWRGWWGDNPPYHTSVFVLTHHKRPPLEMEGGTTFHFITDGIDSALKKARDAADGKDVRLGGGVTTIREYLKAGLVDELHLAIAPVLVGAGENLLKDIDLVQLGYQVVDHIASPKATHVVLKKK